MFNMQPQLHHYYQPYDNYNYYYLEEKDSDYESLNKNYNNGTKKISIFNR